MTTKPPSEDDPVTLKEACEHFGNRFAVSTLRAEAARGRLIIFRLGHRDFTTIAGVRDMVRKCQDAARLHASISTRSAELGQSETDQALSAQAALNQTVVALKQGLPHISGTNTNRSAGRTR